MILTLFKLLLVVYAAIIFGNLYAGIKIWKLRHRWSKFIAPVFFANAINAALNAITIGFSPPPVRIVWWPVILLFVGRGLLAISISVLIVFLFGWINGVGPATDQKESA